MEKNQRKERTARTAFQKRHGRLPGQGPLLGGWGAERDGCRPAVLDAARRAESQGLRPAANLLPGPIGGSRRDLPHRGIVCKRRRLPEKAPGVERIPDLRRPHEKRLHLRDLPVKEEGQLPPGLAPGRARLLPSPYHIRRRAGTVRRSAADQTARSPVVYRGTKRVGAA